MKKGFISLLVCLLACCTMASAQAVEKNKLQKDAEAAYEKKTFITARYLYIRAYEDYFKNGSLKQGVECVSKGNDLYLREGLYQEGFDLLSRVDQAIESKTISPSEKAALHYEVSKERMKMYMNMHRPQSAQEHLNVMENHAKISGNDDVMNDLLYNKAIYYYTFGQNAKGNEVFKEMANKLTASKEYDKVDKVYKTLIANGRKSNNASIVAQSYNNYMLWKDSVNALKSADEIKALKQQITERDETIDDMDSSLTTRMAIIWGLAILAGALAAALAVGAVVLMRFILLTRKQKKTIKMANDSNAQKAKFISNISAQLEPTLQKLDKKTPEVQALLDFSSHIETLSSLENSTDEVEMEEVSINKFCEELMEPIRAKAKKDVTLNVNAPKMTLTTNKELVGHILTHLLENAVEYVNDEGTIVLEYKKRGAHSHQFLVSNTGEPMAEELREEVFTPFREVRDLTKGDGLGLPICRQMALKMGGDLEIDPQFTKGTRFILELHS